MLKVTEKNLDGRCAAYAMCEFSKFMGHYSALVFIQFFYKIKIAPISFVRFFLRKNFTQNERIRISYFRFVIFYLCQFKFLMQLIEQKFSVKFQTKSEITRNCRNLQILCVMYSKKCCNDKLKIWQKFLKQSQHLWNYKLDSTIHGYLNKLTKAWKSKKNIYLKINFKFLIKEKSL